MVLGSELRPKTRQEKGDAQRERERDCKCHQREEEKKEGRDPQTRWENKCAFSHYSLKSVPIQMFRWRRFALLLTPHLGKKEQNVLSTVFIQELFRSSLEDCTCSYCIERARILRCDFLS